MVMEVPIGGLHVKGIVCMSVEVEKDAQRMTGISSKEGSKESRGMGVQV